MVYGKLIGYSEDKAEDVAPADLPKYADLDYYFGVRFTKRGSFLLASMSFVVVFSIILLLTIAFFLYSMLVILRQRRLSEMQKDFINNMTHEFKTPISTIKISADVFENTDVIKDNPRLKRYATIISEQNQRLNNQVEKVLQIARIERENFQLMLEPVNLNELLLDVIRNVEPKLEELGGEISIELPSESVEITADKTHLLNIIYNLIDNAMKYCVQEPKVNLKVSSNSQHYQVSVKDNGPGIPKQYQERVFEKFFRIPTGNVHDVKGFGLGLFYIKNVVKSHGWGIELNSQEKAGTEIILTIKKPKPASQWFSSWRQRLQTAKSS